MSTSNKYQAPFLRVIIALGRPIGNDATDTEYQDVIVSVIKQVTPPSLVQRLLLWNKRSLISVTDIVRVMSHAGLNSHEPPLERAINAFWKHSLVPLCPAVESLAVSSKDAVIRNGALSVTNLIRDKHPLFSAVIYREVFEYVLRVNNYPMRIDDPVYDGNNPMHRVTITGASVLDRYMANLDLKGFTANDDLPELYKNLGIGIYAEA